MPHVASVCHMLPCCWCNHCTSLQERQLLAEGVNGWQQNYFMPGTSDTGTDEGEGSREQVEGTRGGCVSTRCMQQGLRCRKYSNSQAATVWPVTACGLHNQLFCSLSLC